MSKPCHGITTRHDETVLANWPDSLKGNPHLDGRIREEDWPGNYVLREADSRLRLFGTGPMVPRLKGRLP